MATENKKSEQAPRKLLKRKAFYWLVVAVGVFGGLVVYSAVLYIPTKTGSYSNSANTTTNFTPPDFDLDKITDESAQADNQQKGHQFIPMSFNSLLEAPDAEVAVRSACKTFAKKEFTDDAAPLVIVKKCNNFSNSSSE